LSAYLFIAFCVLAVAGASGVLLCQGGKKLGAAWLVCCFSLSALSVFHPGAAWIACLALALLGMGLAATLTPLSPTEPPAFHTGFFRRLIAVASVWAVSLLILRSSHRSPHLIVDAGTSTAGPQLYWSLYTTAALFGLGFLTLILKRGAAQAWSGIALLFLCPVPAALASAARLGSPEGTHLALFAVAVCAVHAALAVGTLKYVHRISGGLDTQTWEELQG